MSAHTQTGPTTRRPLALRGQARRLADSTAQKRQGANAAIALYSRNGHDITKRFPTIAAAAATVPVRSAIIDGELVASNIAGVPQFAKIGTRDTGEHTHLFWAFDLLALNGRDWRAKPLKDRRARLQALLDRAAHDAFRYSEDFADADKLLAACETMGLEGIVAKHQDKPYRSGRRPEWVKVKCAAWKAANRNRFELFRRRRRRCPDSRRDPPQSGIYT